MFTRPATTLPIALRSIGAVLLAALLICNSAAGGEGRVGPEEVTQAIELGKKSLLRILAQADPRFSGMPGYQMLRVMALLNCGVKPDAPEMAAAIKEIINNPNRAVADQYAGSYQAGLMLVMLSMLHDPNNKRLASDMVRKLQQFQTADGGWGDNSRTQFALLGLKAAEDMGIEVPDDVFKRALKYTESGQNPDGGWGYTPGQPGSYGSMTCAGITSLYICGARMYKSTKVCGQGVSDKRLVAGLEWLANNFTVRTNPKTGGHHYYYLYGLERIGVLMAQKTIGGHDWYREGVEYLVHSQHADGTFGDEHMDMLSTEFALLFLGKGSAPIAVQKLRYGKDWNRVPYDMKNLMEAASRDLNQPMTYQVVDQFARVEDLAAAPILYLNGEEAFAFDPEFRKVLRAFLENGGFLIASSCCGSKEFDKSFREEMKLLFPDAAWDKLPPDHPVYNARYKIAKQEAFMIEGLNTGCRTSVLYAPHAVCCGWGSCGGCKDPQMVPTDPGLQLGTNMVAYALGFQKLRHKLEEVKVFTKPANEKVARGALLVGQIFHGGEWDPDPAALPNLTQTLRQQAGMKAEVAKRRVVLGSDDPGDYPLLFITGHREFQLDENQVKILREYLDRGGMLFGDACCGKPSFDLAFRKLCTQLYPDRKLERIATAHPIFRAPFVIDKANYKPMALRLYDDLHGEPFLEGITDGKGRLCIVYSKINLGCELQGHACPTCIGYQAQDAYQIATNVLVYALSH